MMARNPHGAQGLIDVETAQYFIGQLWPDGGPDGAYLVHAHMATGGGPACTWVPLPEVSDCLAPWLEKHATGRNAYFGVALRDARCEPHMRPPEDPVPLGGNMDICAVPALVLDIDDRRGVHSETALPRDDAESQAFLASLPWAPTFAVDTGGGLHVYYAFKEPYLIESEDEREAIRDLSERFRTYVIDAARQRHGWNIDMLPQLSIILRWPGSLNHKMSKPVPVQLIHEGAERYNPADFETYLPPPNPRREHRQGNSHTGDIDIATVMEHYKVKLREKNLRRDEWQAAHPVHGSTHGNNLAVNTAKGTWYCYRHSVGGDALNFIAVAENLIECHESRRGVFSGNPELFGKVVAIANEKFSTGIDWKTLIEPDIPDGYDVPPHGDEDVPPSGSGQDEPSTPPPKTNAWDSIETLTEFLSHQIEIPEGLARDIVFPGGITTISAPAGTGKSVAILQLAYELARGGVYRGEKLDIAKVLYLDGDNPESLLSYRLKQICEHRNIAFSVLTRGKIPKLYERKQWEQLAAKDYDVIIIDSFGSLTPGISWKDEGPLQKVIDTLLMIADQGPALIVLENTTKAALSYKGGGDKVNRIDAFYEIRDVTNWTPSSGSYWWKDLPTGADDEFKERASRKNEQTRMQLAWICRKFRWSEEPAPFVVEIDFAASPWSLTDVTEEIEALGTERASQERANQQQHMETAAYALRHELLKRPEDNLMGKTEAEEFLKGQGLKLRVARGLIDSYNATVFQSVGLWTIESIGGRGSKKALVPFPPPTKVGDRNTGTPIPPLIKKSDDRNTSIHKPNKNSGENASVFCQPDDERMTENSHFLLVEYKRVTEPVFSVVDSDTKGGLPPETVPSRTKKAPCNVQDDQGARRIPRKRKSDRSAIDVDFRPVSDDPEDQDRVRFEI